MAALYYYSTPLTILAFVLFLVSETSGKVRRNSDGSLISNAGPSQLVQRFFARSKRTSFYINPNPSGNNGGSISQSMADTIVSEHNKFRRMVPSTNMQLMRWDTELAASAQAHADQCIFQHTPAPRPWGENMYAGHSSSEVSSSVNFWFSEAYTYKCGCTNMYTDCCGHYTQVVWAETNKVGCGLAACTNGIYYTSGQQYLLICHYGPSGNQLNPEAAQQGRFESLPAFYYRGASESPCSACPAGASCDNGLCVT